MPAHEKIAPVAGKDLTEAIRQYIFQQAR
jgi:hypothetical protein